MQRHQRKSTKSRIQLIVLNYIQPSFFKVEFKLRDYGTLFHLDTTNWYCLLNPLKAIAKETKKITTGNKNKEYNEVKKSD